MTTGQAGFVGFPPKVAVVERMKLVDVPPEAREAFTAYLGNRAQYTRSGEVVFEKRIYAEWKRQH